MNTNLGNLANSLNETIERHCSNLPTGTLESVTDLNALSRRLLCSPEVAQKIVASGALQPTGPVHRGDTNGPQTFLADDLNEIRRAVLTAIVESVIDESGGDAAEISLASGHALNEHVKGFAKPKPGEQREFSRGAERGRVNFGSYAGQSDDDEPGPFQRATMTAGKVAAVGAAAYGGAAWLRGRIAQPGAPLLDQLKAGNVANIATGRAVAGVLSAGAAKVATVLRGKRPPLGV